METVPLRESATEVLVVGSEGSTVGSVDASSAPVLRLRLKKPMPDRKVGWREGTVDNENMGKKKSKCCCIYKKPVNFGESSSSDDEECEHCFGHPEKRRKNIKKHDPDNDILSSNNDPQHNGAEDNDHETINEQTSKERIQSPQPTDNVSPIENLQ